ncbi:hypothetical protein SISSUDRAFT_784178 [Sistotremastrum suecicum HHB10207 ss-3]|uniref:Uncharacterized protein n=1 Tax=Sistotremastrum suecicum HHB10207 ss-3 TaxID=1314776 RepID=A0A166D339_9AGAM|nr:hypothetical protein SISSUDRAFT_784178 [Sistotremastrum suecicum HHB10207 ss-3]
MRPFGCTILSILTQLNTTRPQNGVKLSLRRNGHDGFRWTGNDGIIRLLGTYIKFWWLPESEEMRIYELRKLERTLYPALPFVYLAPASASSSSLHASLHVTRSSSLKRNRT